MWINRRLGGINMGDQYDYYSYVLEDNYLADMELEEANARDLEVEKQNKKSA
jgi:hypothetical protein